jgi:hypothetical protein
MPAKPRSIIAHVDGSGTAETDLRVMVPGQIGITQIQGEIIHRNRETATIAKIKGLRGIVEVNSNRPIVAVDCRINLTLESSRQEG